MEKAVLEFTAGSLAAMIAETITQPLDAAKTRLQLQNHAVSLGLPQQSSQTTPTLPKYRGMVSTTVLMVKEEGLWSLYRGLPPALMRQVVKAGFQMSLYKRIRGFFEGAGARKPRFHEKLGSAMASGVIAQAISNPFDVVKVRLQADGRRLLFGEGLQYRSATHAWTAIYQENGIRGFWRGCVPSVARAGVHAGVGLSTYDHCKSILIGLGFSDAPHTHAATSLISSLCSTAVSTPWDVLKTRMIADTLSPLPAPSPSDVRPAPASHPAAGAGIEGSGSQRSAGRLGMRYSSTLQCFTHTVASEGLFSLWKGFIPGYLRTSPWQFCFFISYELIGQALVGKGI